MEKEKIKIEDLKMLETILQEIPSNIFFKDKECRYVFATHYWRHLKRDEDNENWDIKGKTDLEIRKDVENAKHAYEMDKQILETGKGITYITKIEQDGITEYLELIKNPVFDETGQVIGIVGLINDVTEKVLLEQKLEALATKDQLTGLYNRSYLDRWIKEINSKELYPLSIIFADCNHLKQINDEYGHIAGDKYITTTVEVMKNNLPENSYLFRIGGDEFLVLLPNTDESLTKKYIEEIKQLCSRININQQELSVAFGSKTIDEYVDDLLPYIELADNEMYQNKIKMHKQKI